MNQSLMVSPKYHPLLKKFWNMIKSKCPACNTTFWNQVTVEKTVKWYKFQQVELYCPSCKVQLKEKKFFLYFVVLLLLIFLFIYD